MSSWNFADLYEGIAARIPDHPCQIQGDRVITWGHFDARTNALTADLLRVGLSHSSKVAAYLYNCPEYLETYIAAFKGGFVPANTNYRYGPEEVSYLFDNSDAEAVVFHAAFTPLVDRIRSNLPKVKRWYCVADGTHSVPDWATDYEAVVGPGLTTSVSGPWGRSQDGLLFLYTGGTTGMPKGVMWRQYDILHVLGLGGNALLGVPPADSIEEIIDRMDPGVPATILLTACPLMHGTGQFSSFLAMNMGGAVVTLKSRSFDVAELLSEIERNRVQTLIIVGQAFADPILDTLTENPDRYDLSSLVMISSSGVMWSQENKDGLLSFIPQVILFDSFGSSEAIGMGGSVSTSGAISETAKFVLGPKCAVFTEDGRRVQPGSGERGLVAVGGNIPMGYYKDEVKSAQTFRIFDEQRWSVPGDWAEVQSDGTLVLLGRGSVCINTGGEKVFPEEVEEVLKRHVSVRDAVAVGIADARFGETICAVVEAVPGQVPTLLELSEHVKAALSSFKAPRSLVVVASIGRAPNGKVDYKRLKALALKELGLEI